MTTKFSRRFAGYGLVAALCAASFLFARGTRHPFSAKAPDFRQRGPAGAKIMVVEFSDFQCPACRAAEPTVRQMLTVYDDKMRFVFKHFPLRMHEWARDGARAAECAGRQGKFWPYHDQLYDHQDDWTNAKFDQVLTAYAREQGLDMDAWSACRKDPATTAAIDADVKDGGDAWVGATPTFFINGRRFVGYKELADFGVPFIDKELAK
jgi:protein-disulfide isomerase